MADLSITGEVVVTSEKAEGAFDRVGAKAGQMASKVQAEATKAGAAVDNIGTGAEAGAEKFTRAESRMRSAIQKSTRELEMLGKTASQKFEAQLEFKGLDKAKFQPFLDELRKAEEATKKAESGLSGLGSAAQAAGRAMAVAFSGAAAFGVVGKLVEVQREFDVLNSSLKTVTGSSAAAERELSWLKTFAKETPFGLAQATQGFVKMKALGLDPTRAALTSFGNTASAMGKDLNQMIEAVADASTGEFERLKEFGIKAKKEGDNVSLTFQGVTTTIKNSASEITKYLEDIGNVQFGGAMAERAKTLDGAISELGDTWDELFRTINERNAGTLIYDSIKLANGAIEDATTIIKAMTAAYDDSGRATGALTTFQEGVATVFETVAVLGANLKYVITQVGVEIGGLAAQVAQAAQFNFAGVAAIREQMVADAEEARKQIDLTEKRILGARKAQEEYARYATRNASAATDPRRIDLGTSSAPTVATRAGARATKEALSEYDKLMQRLGVDLPKAAAAAEAAQHGYNKAQEEFIALAGSAVWAGFTNQQRAQVAALFENRIASEQAADAAKTLAKANLDAAASREKYLTSLSTGLDKIKADTAAQLEATARLGLSKEAIAELDAAKLEMLATDLELQAIKQMDRNLDEQTYNALKQQAEAYRELAAAKKAGAAKEMELDLVKANREAAKKAADEWQRAADDINRSLTDALLRGFESGKGFAENLRSTLKNMFSTLVLRPVISAVMSPVAGAINGMLYGNAAAAAGGGASALGMLGSGANLITGLQGTQGMLGTVGGWLGLNTVAANTGLAATIGIDAASAAAAANAAGAAGGGLLSGVGAALPWIGGIAALVSILGGLDDSGTYHTGGAAQYSGARGLMSGQDATGYNIGFGRVEAGAQTITAVSTLAQSLGTALDGIAVAFGQTAGYEIATAFADDTSEDGAWGGLRISRDGQELLNWENNRQSRWAPREFGDGEEGYRQYLAAVAQDTRQVLLDMDLPSWADDMLESIGDSASMEQLTGVLNQIGVVQSAFVALGRSMEMFSSLTDAMQSGLLDAAGSIEALTAGAGAFYQGFYSEQERIDSAVAQLNEALTGLDLSIDPRLGDDAKDQFRAAVEAAFAAGDAELAAALLALSGTFANTADYFQQLASQQADTMGRLQIDLLRAQGNNLAAVALERERELAALAQFGPAAVAMQQQIYGLIDAMAASNAAANAYFADIDRAAAEQGYTDDAQAALDAMFGSISGGADAAAQSAASAAADAAKAAAASWRTAASSIQSSLEKLRASTTALSDPASRYAETKSVLDEYTRLALGGDASAAEKLAGAADAFLSASADGTITQAEYLRDRVLTEAKLASVLESSEAQASLQESIASSAGAAVSELQALNSNLTGFAGDLYDLLRNSYSDVGRDGATGIAATFAKMQADFDAYFNATTGWAAVGSKYSDPSFGGASFTKLDNNMAQFTGADGSIGYIRAGESLLDVAKRIPELRKLWEQTYNIRLPAFAVGTNYVPRDMTARIHEGEAIVPKAFNPWANGGSTGGDSEALIAELRTVTAQLVKVEARLAEIEKTNDQMAQQQDNGTDGGNAYRAEIMNVAALAQAIKEATV
jgi:hypothetical protein